MLIRLKDLKTLRVVSRDGGHHAVLDLFASGQAPRVTHVVSRLGSWFEGRQCVMRVGAFDAPDLDRGEWPVRVDRGEVEAAPGAGADGSGDGAAVLLAAEDEEADPVMLSRAECDRAAPAGEDIHSVNALLGAPLRASDRQAGTLMDVIVETDDRSVAMLVVRAGAHGREHQRVVPTGMVERIDWEAPAIAIRCGAASVDDSPDLHEMSGALHGRWYNQVLAYYGLG